MSYTQDDHNNERSGTHFDRASLVRLMCGVVGSVSISLTVQRRGMLTRDGAVAAIVTGTLTTWRGGFLKAVLLIAFFGASSALSRTSTRQKQKIATFAAKSAERDAMQVLANGGVATLIATAGLGHRSDHAYIGALAAAAGDTWATEIGGMSRSQPRHILTLAPVPPGTSGGVTVAGVLASAAGGAFIGLVAEAGSIFGSSSRGPRCTAIATGLIAGLTGSFVDSLLGATVQERRWCPSCGVATERVTHVCGFPTVISGGVQRLDNDIVNLLSTGFGACTGWLMTRLLHWRRAWR